MDDVIKLFNPNDIPFGKLSNNAYHPMTINGKKYPTVTNYIFSNMLTTPAFKQNIQNTEIRGSSKLNQELMTAIDFLIEKQKIRNLDGLMKTDPETGALITEVEPVSIDDMVQTIIQNTDYTRDDIYGDQNKPSHLRVRWPRIRIFEEYNKLEKARLYEQSGGESAQQAWLEYSKTGELKKSQKELEEQQKYMRIVSNEVRKPFESINLVELKQKLLAESEMNQMGIYQLYDRYVNEEIFNILRVATEKGYKARFEKPELAELLLSTGNSPIQYESPDPFLGIGSDGRGSNLVGITLMQIRHNMKIQKTQEEREHQEQLYYKNIYDTYLAYTILRTEMFTNRNNLEEYLGLSPTQIIEKYGLENIIGGVPTQDTIVMLYKRDKLNPIIMKEIFQPGTLVINVRKTGIRQLQEQLLKDKKDIIFNSYLAYMIRHKYKDNLDTEIKRHQEIEDQLRKGHKGMNKKTKSFLIKGQRNRQEIENDVIDDAIAQQKTELAGDKLEKLKARVIDLFNLGMLSASLSDKIDSDIEKLNIPSDEDVESAELAELPVTPAVVVEEKEEEEGDMSDSSSMSEGSSDSMTKYLKDVFKMRKKDLIEMIIKIKGGNEEDYNNWTMKELKQRLDGLELEEWGGKKEEIQEAKPSIQGGIFIQPQGQPIGIFKELDQNRPEFRPFAPEEFTGMLEIDHRSYPTIQHYIIAKLIASTGTRKKVDSFGDISFIKGIGINTAHSMILVEPNLTGKKPEDFLNIPLTGEVYDKLQNETNNLLLPLYTVTALNEKFSDVSMQNLLILTGDRKIEWMSPYNLYLGSGTEKQPGINYVGKTMMDIRDKLKVTRTQQKEVVIDPSDLEKFIKKDAFVMAWVKMRIKDMCGVVYKAQQYLKIKEGLDFNMQEDEDLQRLIRFVLDELYQPCRALVELSDKDKTPVPDFIVKLVQKCSGMSTGIQPSKKMNNKGEYTWNKEIQAKISENDRRLSQLDREFWGGVRIEHTQSESQEFNDHQIKEWHNFWKELNASDMSIDEKNEEASRFREQQKEEYNEFWGIDTTIKSKDDISRYEHEKTEIKEELRSYLAKIKRIERENNLVYQEISQIYWDRIRVMLNALIINLNPATDSAIRDVLVKVEELNSDKTKCVRIITNEEDNCIISALINLLTGIYEMKSRFSPTEDLDEDDVSFAGSIIMNSDVQIKHINTEEESEVSDIGSEGEEEFDIGEDGAFPDDFDENEEQGDYEENEEQGDYEDLPDEYEDNPYFEFNGKSKKRKLKQVQKLGVDGDLARIEQQVMLISSVNSKNVAEAIMKMVQTIKFSRMSEKVKQNRINFFATIR